LDLSVPFSAPLEAGPSPPSPCFPRVSLLGSPCLLVSPSPSPPAVWAFCCDFFPCEKNHSSEGARVLTQIFPPSLNPGADPSTIFRSCCLSKYPVLFGGVPQTPRPADTPHFSLFLQLLHELQCRSSPFSPPPLPFHIL